MPPHRKSSSRLKSSSEPRLLRAKFKSEPTDRRKKLNDTKRRIGERDIDDWVCRFLDNLAAIEKERCNPHDCRRSIRFEKPRCYEDKSSSYRRLRSPTPYSWDRVKKEPESPARSSAGDSSEEHCEAILPRAELSRIRKSSRARPGRKGCLGAGHAKRDRSLEERELLRKINRHIKDGFTEGKRRARAYICKALNFALERGYLKPADRRGKLLRVAPSLADQVKSAVSGARSHARKPRRSGIRRRNASRSFRRRRRGNLGKRRRSGMKRRSSRSRVVRKRRMTRRGNHPLGNNEKLPTKIHPSNEPEKSRSGSRCREFSHESQRSGNNSGSRAPSRSGSRHNSPERPNFNDPVQEKKPSQTRINYERPDSPNSVDLADVEPLDNSDNNNNDERDNNYNNYDNYNNDANEMNEDNDMNEANVNKDGQ